MIAMAGSRIRSLFTALVALSALAGASAAAAQSVTSVPNAVRYAGIGTNNRGYNSDFGSAGTVELNMPTALNFDNAGRLLIADRDNNCVRRVDTTSLHLMTTIAGLKGSGAADTCNTASNATPTPAQGLLQPSGVAADQAGNVFISDTGHNCVRELPAGASSNATLVTVAGTCGASNTASTTPVPTALQVDPSGNLYIVIRDTTDGIYQVLRHNVGTAAGTLCRAAGAASAAGVAQCPDVAAPPSLNRPSGLSLDGAGALYIADSGNNCVRKAQSGVFSTAYGTCGSSSSAVVAPRDVAFSAAGVMLISLENNNQLLRYNQATGETTVIAGNANGTPGAYSAAQDGAASSSLPLNGPAGVVYDANNNLYVADSGNSIVRELVNGNLFGQVTVGSASSQQVLTFQINTASTLAVTAGVDYSIVPGTDTCSGAQTPAAAGAPPAFCSVGVVFSPTLPGNRFSPVMVTTTAGAASAPVAVGLQGTGLGPQAQLFPGQAGTVAGGFASVIDLGRDSTSCVYVLQRPTAGAAAEVQRFQTGACNAGTVIPQGAGLQQPQAIASDAAGNWYVADLAGSSTGAASVQRYGADGSVNRDYITNVVAPRALEVDGFGNVVLVEQGAKNDVVKVFAGGERQVVTGGGTVAPTEGAVASTIKLGLPTGVTVGPQGTIYITDAAAHRVFSVDPDGIFHITAGNGTTTTTVANTALGQALVSPTDIEVDAAGDLNIVDPGSNSVYTLFAAASAGNNMRRIFGLGSGAAGNSGDGGPSNAAALKDPEAVTITSDGTVYIADNGNGAIREVTFPDSTVDFGTVAVGSSATAVQSLWNDGNAQLLRSGDPVITGSTAFSNNAGETTCGSAIIPGLLCNVAFQLTPTNPGPATATALINDNSAATPQTVHLVGTVVPAAVQSFTAPAETENYGGPYVGTATLTTNGGTVPNGTLTFTVNGTITCVVTGDIQGAVSCTLPAGTGLSVAGSPYTVTVDFVDAHGNYPAQHTTTTLTELRRTLTETVTSKSRAYMQANPVLDGVPNGTLPGAYSDSFNVAYVACAVQFTATSTCAAGSPAVTSTTPPGIYTISATVTPNGATNAANYTVNVVPGSLAITKLALPGFGGGLETEVYGGAYTGTATFATAAGGGTPTGSVTFSVNGQTLCSTAVSTAASCTLAAGTGLGVGTYTVNIAYSGDSNYAATASTATLNVTPAQLTVTVANQSKAFGAAVPNLNGTATVAGLVNGDAVGTTILLTYATTVTVSTPSGTYPNSITVTVSGASAHNYSITNVPGAFTVGGTATTTTITTSGSPVASGASVTFTAVVAATAGGQVPNGTVAFTSDGAAIGTGTLDATGTATLTTSTLTGGTHTVTATYAGNANFAGSSGSLTEAVAVPTGSFVLAATPDTQLIRGSGTTTYTASVTSVNGFAGPVRLTCSGLPADATCALSVTTVNLTPGAGVQFTVTTTTTNADAVVAANVQPRDARPGSWPASLAITAAAAFPMQLSGLGVLLAGVRRRRLDGKPSRVLLLVLLSIALVGLAGCGCPSTAFHTYPITITGTSVNGGPAPASKTVYLSVGQTL